MAKIFITGSSDGLGLLAAKELIKQGHTVVLHARNEKRRQEALEQLPDADAVLTADLSDTEETKNLATNVNAIGPFNVIIHNAGVYQASAKEIFAVNTLAPYLLTCLIKKPQRLIYLSSGMHKSGQFQTKDFSVENQQTSYSNSKLHVAMLTMAVARKWYDVIANAVDPGWVPTKMGGKGAPDDLKKGYETQVWLAGSNEATAEISGRYLHHKAEDQASPLANDIALQDKLLRLCEQLTEISLQ